jgi:hypothetical protein
MDTGDIVKAASFVERYLSIDAVGICGIGGRGEGGGGGTGLCVSSSQNFGLVKSALDPSSAIQLRSAENKLRELVKLRLDDAIIRNQPEDILKYSAHSGTSVCCSVAVFRFS